jgi:hypothetical protein
LLGRALRLALATRRRRSSAVKVVTATVDELMARSVTASLATQRQMIAEISNGKIDLHQTYRPGLM